MFPIMFKIQQTNWLLNYLIPIIKIQKKDPLLEKLSSVILKIPLIPASKNPFKAGF